MKQIINTNNAPAPIGPYNQAVKSGHLLYTSGQIPIDPQTGDMADFPEMNALYAEYFGEDNAPARSTIQVAALPKGALVEIEAIARR